MSLHTQTCAHIPSHTGTPYTITHRHTTDHQSPPLSILLDVKRPCIGGHIPSETPGVHKASKEVPSWICQKAGNTSKLKVHRASHVCCFKKVIGEETMTRIMPMITRSLREASFGGQLSKATTLRARISRDLSAKIWEENPLQPSRSL